MHILLGCLLILSCVLFASTAQANSRIGEFLTKVQASEVFPGADGFGAVQGDPPYARVFKGQEAVGYVFLTTDIVNTRGYSSKPIDTLIALDNEGTIVGAKLVEHHEPIVLIGIPESRMVDFINGYVGMNLIKNPLPVGAPPPVDMISGATVTLMVIGDNILRSSRIMGQAYQIGMAPEAAASVAATEAAVEVTSQVINPDLLEIKSWDTLLEEGAIANLDINVGEVNQLFIDSGRRGGDRKQQAGAPEDNFVDLYAAVVSVPTIGRSLLGESEFEYMQSRLKEGQQAILLAGNGIYSFKGSGYVRGGIFDRFDIIQGEHSFRFTDLEHRRLYDVRAEGAPRFKEVGIFFVSEEYDFFNAVEPWRLQLLIQREISVHEKIFIPVELNYHLPAIYTMDDPAAPVVAQQPATAPAATTAPQAAASGPVQHEATSHAQMFDDEVPLWQIIWKSKMPQIIVVVLSLIVLGFVFFFQHALVKREKLYTYFRTGFLLFSLFYIGWYANAQLSVVNVLTFTTSLRTEFSWEYFLMDPIVFILWCATAISMIFWNRGAFCGWLCPFGSLQELLNKAAKKLGIKQIKVPYAIHHRAAAIKYVIFIALFGFSLYDLAFAEKMAEVEPFKTAIILKFLRSWPFVTFAVLLLVAGLFIERFYCRYLCALGAGLAIPSRLRIFDWLRRYKMCGDPCQRCAVECPVDAITPEGPIEPNECIQCLHCQMLYLHEKKCPELIQRSAKRRRRPAPGTEAKQEPVFTEEVLRFMPNATAFEAKPKQVKE
ncbi:MAG: 4Fe-4S binding protein [Alcaligenaceae bacterium]|nr:4Fe-4S binding protein [Alcaligenaceae bacterium]